MWVRLETPTTTFEMQTQLMGKPNLSNTLAAVAVASDLGIEPAAIQRGIENSPAIPGRFEWIDRGQPFHVFVDYAHTPDALQKVFRLRASCNRNACWLSSVAEENATEPSVLRWRRLPRRSLTSSGSLPTTRVARIQCRSWRRSKLGSKANPARHQTEPDRHTAIREALRHAQPGDAVVIAGKGHETYQVLADRTIHFDDREEARLALGELGFDS